MIQAGTAPSHGFEASDFASAAPSLRVALREVRRALTRGLFDTYRPEKHYMRGPGPKWQEKHGLAGH
jgi:hypothetical protein